MYTHIKFTICTLLASLLLSSNAFAVDFDQDGYDDFVLIDTSGNRLEWYAIDVNDPQRRSLGQFGRIGDHMAVGSWSSDSLSSKGFIKKRQSGIFDWNIQLASGQKSFNFGSYPDVAISGLDIDRNGAIDPTVVSKEGNKLKWKIIANPLSASAAPQEVIFGNKRDFPFYSNLDGQGDKITTAKVDKKRGLIISYMNLTDAKIKSVRIKDFKSKIKTILPVAQANGKDALFVVSGKGKKLNITIIKNGKKSKVLNTKGDEIVTGRYLGQGAPEVLVVRNGTDKAVFVDIKGKKSALTIDLAGVLVDEVNINSFSAKGGSDDSPSSPVATPVPGKPEPTPTSPRSPPPVCSGTAVSSDHLLYKPVSDTSGNAVLVFDSKYSREFLSVKIQLKDGSFTEAWWKGLELWGNPDAFGPRQHWRTNVRASQVKDYALIIVDDTSQECRFTLPGSANRRWE